LGDDTTTSSEGMGKADALSKIVCHQKPLGEIICVKSVCCKISVCCVTFLCLHFLNSDARNVMSDTKILFSKLILKV